MYISACMMKGERVARIRERKREKTTESPAEKAQKYWPSKGRGWGRLEPKGRGSPRQRGRGPECPLRLSLREREGKDVDVGVYGQAKQSLTVQRETD